MTISENNKFPWTVIFLDLQSTTIASRKNLESNRAHLQGSLQSIQAIIQEEKRQAQVWGGGICFTFHPINCKDPLVLKDSLEFEDEKRFSKSTFFFLNSFFPSL